jgi:hypothetical protein
MGQQPPHDSLSPTEAHPAILSLATIRTAQVDDFARSLTAQGLKPKTVHNTYKDFREILDWNRQQLDQPKACFYTKLPKPSAERLRWFTLQETDMLVSAAHGQYKPLFRLAGFPVCVVVNWPAPI